MLDTLWNLLNSPVAITMLAGAFVWLLNQLYAKKPLWQQYEGSIIAAVKFAEKAIPDGTSITALRRLDTALNMVLKVYEEAKGREASMKEIENLKEGIQIVHAKLEASGNLSSAAAVPAGGSVDVVAPELDK